jgi:hypothetical protein
MGAVATGLQAAWMLARGRAGGLVLLDATDNDMKSAARSFWAIALCLPAFVCLHMLDWTQTGIPPHPAHGFAMDLLGYVVGWMAFALVSRTLAVSMARGKNWPRFIAAWNWCNVVQYLMLVVAALPTLLGLPDPVSQLFWLVAMGWALWLEWFTTKLALDIRGIPAAGLVAMDVAIGLFLVGLTATVS